MNQQSVFIGVGVLAFLAGTLGMLPIVGLTHIAFGPRLVASPDALVASWLSTSALIGLSLHMSLPHRVRALSRLLRSSCLAGVCNGVFVSGVLFYDAGWREGFLVVALIAAVVGGGLGLAMGALLHLPLMALRRIVDRPTGSDAVGWPS
ncbi:MAG: hypothetical protein AB8I08_08745 [Sandaracinaceae bacterium]